MECTSDSLRYRFTRGTPRPCFVSAICTSGSNRYGTEAWRRTSGTESDVCKAPASNPGDCRGRWRTRHCSAGCRAPPASYCTCPSPPVKTIALPNTTPPIPAPGTPWSPRHQTSTFPAEPLTHSIIINCRVNTYALCDIPSAHR